MEHLVPRPSTGSQDNELRPGGQDDTSSGQRTQSNTAASGDGEAWQARR